MDRDIKTEKPRGRALSWVGSQNSKEGICATGSLGRKQKNLAVFSNGINFVLDTSPLPKWKIPCWEDAQSDSYERNQEESQFLSHLNVHLVPTIDGTQHQTP